MQAPHDGLFRLRLTLRVLCISSLLLFMIGARAIDGRTQLAASAALSRGVQALEHAGTPLSLSYSSSESIDTTQAGPDYSGSLQPAGDQQSDQRQLFTFRTSPNINTITPSGHSGLRVGSGINRRRAINATCGETSPRNHFPLMGAMARKVGVLTGGESLREATSFNAPGYFITVPVFPPGCSKVNSPPRWSSL